LRGTNELSVDNGTALNLVRHATRKNTQCFKVFAVGITHEFSVVFSSVLSYCGSYC